MKNQSILTQITGRTAIVVSHDLVNIIVRFFSNRTILLYLLFKIFAWSDARIFAEDADEVNRFVCLFPNNPS